MKKTFAFIKPHDPDMPMDQDAYFHGILACLGNAGFLILHSEIVILDRILLVEHYEKHQNRNFFAPMLDYLTSGESYLLVLGHQDEAVNRLRELAGPTDPKEGLPGQIRHDFGVHGVDLFRNALHASDSPVDAWSEAGRFFDGIDIDATADPVTADDYQVLPKAAQ